MPRYSYMNLFLYVLLVLPCIVQAANMSAYESTSTSNLVIEDMSLSTTQARDGNNITLGYKINASHSTTAKLYADFVAPNGFEFTDTAIENGISVDIDAGMHWYYLTCRINLYPKPAYGLYDVELSIRWEDTGYAFAKYFDCLEILSPVPVCVPSLMYHKIGPVTYNHNWVTPEKFRSQMHALKAYGYTAITYPELMNYRAGLATPPAKPVLITFDDGYESLLTDAYPIISDPSINFKITCFLPTGMLGGTNDWDVVDNFPEINHLTWSQVEWLHSTGLVDFQSHTVNHVNLYDISNDPSTMSYELSTSKAEIETRLNKTVDILCYPYGASTDAAEEAARKAGYFAAVKADGGLDLTAEHKWLLKRIHLHRWIDTEYDPANPENFLFHESTIPDPDVTIPLITVVEMQYQDPSTGEPLPNNDITRGKAAKIVCSASNTGEAAGVMPVLEIDSDSDPANGIFTSLSSAISTFDPGTQTFYWTWQIPADAPPGAYYTRVIFRDSRNVLGFHKSAWQEAVNVTESSNIYNPMSIAEAKNKPDGTLVEIDNAVVSGNYNGFFYVQHPELLGGIRVSYPDSSPSVGTVVKLQGKVGSLNSGERVIFDAVVVQN